MAARRVLSPDADRHHGRAHELHASDVRRLPLDVDLAHVDDAGQAEPGGGGGARDAVLTRARLGDDALGTQPLRKQGLAQGVIDLVRAGVRQVLALEPDARAPALGERRRKRERGGTAHPGY